MLQTPVLLITFNRAENTRKVLEALKQVNPKYLFVFQDGAREGNAADKAKCAAVRSTFNQIDWECEVKTYYSEKNLGCGKGPSTGIKWFFENVEQGIVLEDDCVPNSDFFIFCETLLDKYKDDKRISYIGGTNYQDGIKRGNGSYYFSDGHHGTWGWASWRRTWNFFDYYLTDFENEQFSRITQKYFVGKRMKEYWTEIFKVVKQNRFNESCWDYQFYFGCWRQNMLAIIPQTNLVANIGDDIDANHTQGNGILLYRKTETILPVTHPTEVYQNQEADYYLHKKYVQPYEYGWSGLKRLPQRLNKRLKALLKKEGSWFR